MISQHASKVFQGQVSDESHLFLSQPVEESQPHNCVLLFLAFHKINDGYVPIRKYFRETLRS